MPVEQEPLVLDVGNSHHEIRADDTAAHPTTEQKRQPAEHLPLGDILLVFKGVSNPFRELLVVRHVGGTDQTSANGFSSADGPYTDGTGTSSRRKYTSNCPRW